MGGGGSRGLLQEMDEFPFPFFPLRGRCCYIGLRSNWFRFWIHSWVGGLVGMVSKAFPFLRVVRYFG